MSSIQDNQEILYDKQIVEWMHPIQRVTSSLSILGSVVIICQVLRERKQKLKVMYHRIILCMSICDFIGSTALFFGSWATPKDVEEEWLWDNIGTQFTCDLQGYFVNFGFLSVSTCTTFLSVHYLVLIKYNWNQESLKKLECTLWVCICLCLGLSFVHVFTESYNPNPTFCWVQVSDFSQMLYALIE